MKQLAPYLTFSGNCREAMTFYKECLGGELEMSTLGESPMGADSPEMKDQIMHSTLKVGGVDILMGSDMMGPDGVIHGNDITLCVMCDNKEELERFYKNLAVDGKVGQEPKEEFFGIFGDLNDKFGIRWMFQCNSEHAHM
jgi:PhnB protein